MEEWNDDHRERETEMVTAVRGHVLELPAGDCLATTIQPHADDTEAEPQETTHAAEQRAEKPRLTEDVLSTTAQWRS